MSPANEASFISSFPVFVLFIFLALWHWLGPPIWSWIGVVESSYPSLVLSLRGKVASLSPLTMLLAVSFCACPLSGAGSSLILSLLRISFKIRIDFILCYMLFSCIFWDAHYIFSLNKVNDVVWLYNGFCKNLHLKEVWLVRWCAFWVI